MVETALYRSNATTLLVTSIFWIGLGIVVVAIQSKPVSNARSSADLNATLGPINAARTGTSLVRVTNEERGVARAARVRVIGTSASLSRRRSRTT